MIESKMRPVHPGEVLLEEIVAYAAEDMDIPKDDLLAIVECRAPITHELAEKIGYYVGNGPGLWLRMQQSYDERTSSKD